MRRQYCAFEQLKPNWIGCRLDAGRAAAGIEPLILGGDGPGSWLARGLFKQFGVVPATPALVALEPALIHAQFGRGGALALPLAKRLGIPLAVTFHGGDAFKDKHYHGSIIPPIFARRWPELISYASLFVCVSAAVRDKLLERGAPADKLEVIHIGTDDLAPEFTFRRGERLVFAGRFVAKKGIFVLIEAIRTLRARGVSTPVVLAGDGPLLAEARARARGLADVEFAGWLSAPATRAVMDQALALVVPSIAAKNGDREGLPSVAIEAMGRGIPVIASDQTGLSESLETAGAGIGVKAGDAAELAGAMIRLVGNPGLQASMGAAAHHLATTRFSAFQQSRHLESRLRSLL